jgi:hypothetical protein
MAPLDQGLHIDRAALVAATFRPAVVTWNRLEGRARTAAFDGALRAEVRDALWMLCRQWQVGEFRGEPAGSAVLAGVQVDTARITRVAAGPGGAQPYDERVPLETRVEREPVPLDLLTRIRIGRHWLKLLHARTARDLRDVYLAQYPLGDPAAEEARAQLRSDQRAWQVLEAARGRVVDGGALLAAIGGGAHQAFVDASGLSDADRAGALAAARDLASWFQRVYSQPARGEASAWAPPYLEYQFACSTPADPAGESQTVLAADRYHQGHLDWYAFDIDDAPGARLDDRGATSPPGGLQARAPVTFIPTPIEFAGMPRVRWWELEDQRTDFGSLQASTTDLALLMLAEFGLIYGNDWSLVPYDLEVGTLARVRAVVVTDVFGVRTLVRPAGSGAADGWQRWSMYTLSTRQPGGRPDPRLFLAPALGPHQEGRPMERVLLARDEMANMVWAVEEQIPGALGGGVSGHEAALDLARYLTRDGVAAPVEGVATDAAIRYVLGTTVPENWIPFIPVHRPGEQREIRLQRAAMPRLVGDDPDAVVRPRTAILRPGLDVPPVRPYFVNEEEVPRAGVVVTRSFQRARWWDGRVLTWLGRQKQTGRGQAASGLQFDVVVPKPPG